MISSNIYKEDIMCMRKPTPWDLKKMSLTVLGPHDISLWDSLHPDKLGALLKCEIDNVVQGKVSVLLYYIGRYIIEYIATV